MYVNVSMCFSHKLYVLFASLMLGARMVAISKALQAKAQLREVLTVAANKANELEAQLQERYSREIDPFGITPQKCLPDQQDGSFHFRWKPESANTVERSSPSHDANPEALLEGAFPLNRRACELAVKYVHDRRFVLCILYPGSALTTSDTSDLHTDGFS